LGKILVTGGAGYIGSAVTEMLAGRGAGPVVLDNFSQGHRAALPPGVPVIDADLADRAALDRVFAAHSIDAVIHLAAVSVVGDSVSQPLRYYRENVGNLIHLLEAMHNAGCRRIVFSSTASVYGVPAAMPITEDCPLAPINPYGWSKRLGEQILADSASADGKEGAGLRYVALRYFNVAGASQVCGEMHHPESHLVPRVLEVALGKRAHLELYGTDYDTPDGTCLRDYIHILDLAEAHLLALEYTRRRSGVFNLGNNHGYSVREVVDCARRVTGHSIPLKEFPRRAGDPPRLVASHDRARAELGWQPRCNLDEMIASAWEWRRSHPEGYAKS
jgi:UDP-glucose 4-epimerase